MQAQKVREAVGRHESLPLLLRLCLVATALNMRFKDSGRRGEGGGRASEAGAFLSRVTAALSLSWVSVPPLPSPARTDSPMFPEIKLPQLCTHFAVAFCLFIIFRERGREGEGERERNIDV